MSVSSRMTWSRSRPSAPHVGQKPSTCRGEASMTVTSPSATLAPVMNTPSSRVRQMTSATGQPAGAQEVDSTVGPWVEDGRFEHLHLHPRPAHDPPQRAVSDDALRTLNPEEPDHDPGADPHRALFQQMVTFRLIDTYWAIILPQVVAAPMVFILKRFFDAIPHELEEAAMIDGASRLRILLQIVLPLSRAILGAVSILVCIGAWNNFPWPFIASNYANVMTLPVGLQTVITAYGIQYAQVMAQAMLGALPLIVAFLFFQRQIIKVIATSG